ncbi:hypothetical protein CDAR_67661 [Caerostris darwini]|uniref:Uncharacterized protein n=1 Tax=Caerostris darwini TaxID=1538125 RepID=A0AAV4TGF0_9ARAC|nr:hypothetical protein CDAR_67661 [Caerostris darwini]
MMVTNDPAHVDDDCGYHGDHDIRDGHDDHDVCDDDYPTRERVVWMPQVKASKQSLLTCVYIYHRLKPVSVCHHNEKRQNFNQTPVFLVLRLEGVGMERQDGVGPLPVTGCQGNEASVHHPLGGNHDV